MKKLKWILICIVCIFIVFISASLIFRQIYSQKKIKPFTINSPSSKSKVLLATQGSKFKEQINKSLTEIYQKKPVFFQVIDIKDLESYNPVNWHKIIIFSAIEADKIFPTAEKYINKYKKTNKIILITTSGPSKWDKDNLDIDTISVASKQENIIKVISYLEKQINPLINSE